MAVAIVVRPVGAGTMFETSPARAWSKLTPVSLESPWVGVSLGWSLLGLEGLMETASELTGLCIYETIKHHFERWIEMNQVS